MKEVLMAEKNRLTVSEVELAMEAVSAIGQLNI